MRFMTFYVLYSRCMYMYSTCTLWAASIWLHSFNLCIHAKNKEFILCFNQKFMTNNWSYKINLYKIAEILMLVHEWAMKPVVFGSVSCHELFPTHVCVIFCVNIDIIMTSLCLPVPVTHDSFDGPLRDNLNTMFSLAMGLVCRVILVAMVTVAVYYANYSRQQNFH